MQPHLLFTGHEHKAMIINVDAIIRQDHHIIPLTPETNQIHSFNLGAGDMYEVLVPTCSYRMGTERIGYGFAVIGKESN